LQSGKELVCSVPWCKHKSNWGKR